MDKVLIEIEENDRVEVYDKRSTTDSHSEIEGKIVRVKEGETLGTEWTEIVLNSGYKIVLRWYYVRILYKKQ